jgi:hypothetical protein
VDSEAEDRTGRNLDRLTVAQAADALGISQDAVRKRIARRTISHDRDESGRVYVYLMPSETVHKTDQAAMWDAASKTVQDAYIRSLEGQISFLRHELERKDAILLNLTDRIPQLEAPPEARESPESPGPSDTSTEASPEAQEATEPRPRTPWWRRMFGS